MPSLRLLAANPRGARLSNAAGSAASQGDQGAGRGFDIGPTMNVGPWAERLAGALAGRRVVYTTSWDDGLHTDLQLVELGRRHGMPMMLFASPLHGSGRAMHSRDLLEVAQHAEIGSHTLRHTPIDHCSALEARDHVLSGRRHLEQVLGAAVPHFCLVGGRYTRANLAAVKGLVDSVRSTDLLNFGAPVRDGLVQPSLQIRFKGRTHPAKVVWAALSRLALAPALRVAGLALRGARQHDLMAELPRLSAAPEIRVHLWGHSADVAACNAWQELARLFELLNLIGAKPMRYSTFVGTDGPPLAAARVKPK